MGLEKTYPTYERFVNLGFGAKEADFVRLLPIAAKRLDVLTHSRALALAEDDYRLERMRDAVCQLIDVLLLKEGSPQSRGVTSVSNDGYSESYQSQSIEAVETSIRSLCTCWLSGTGLMSAL